MTCLYPIWDPPWDSALPPQGPETLGHLVEERPARLAPALPAPPRSLAAVFTATNTGGWAGGRGGGQVW